MTKLFHTAETDRALRMAQHILDVPGDDPDGVLAVMSRQFLRAMEEVERLQKEAADLREETRRLYQRWRSDSAPVPLYLTREQIDFVLPLIDPDVAEQIRRCLPPEDSHGTKTETE